MPNSQAKQNRRPVKPLLISIVATAILIIFIIIALLLAPVDAIPEFSITDQMGDWDAQAQGKIAVFDDMIEPGAKGKYQFIIKNESTEMLEYGFRLSEYLNNTNIDVNPFMMYRLKADDIPLGDYQWQYVGLDFAQITIEPGSEHRMTLEWWWPYEIDDEHDVRDTLLGIAGGKLSVHIFIWAEVVEG